MLMHLSQYCVGWLAVTVWAYSGRKRPPMSLDSETLNQFLDTLDRFVRERLVPNEERISDDDAIPPELN
jgi:hypothetical protein